jgi:hypothetical protein
MTYGKGGRKSYARLAVFINYRAKSSVPEFIDPVFTKTSPKRSFSVIQNERFGLVFAKTGSIISGTGLISENVTWST